MKREQQLFERKSFIEKIVDISKAKILEIGAFDYPTYPKDQANSYFLDWFSPEEHFTHHPSALDRAKNAVAVDYVVKDKNFSNHISEKFNLVIANHVVEHIPDPIRWFHNISQLLDRNGYLFLAVPHKEYIFDKIRSLTSLREIIRGYDEDLTSPTLYHVFDHLYYYRPIRANNVWENRDCQKLLETKPIPTAKIALKRARDKIEKHGYVDVHCNVFNYKSFLEIFKELYVSQYVDLKIVNSQNVKPTGTEFHVIFQKNSDR
jgi:SAM-dependent methyltransferase